MGRDLAVLSCATPWMFLAHAGSQESPVVTVQSTDFPHTCLMCWICFTAHTSASLSGQLKQPSAIHHPQWEFFRIFWFCVVGHPAGFTPCNSKVNFSKLRQSSGRSSVSTLPTWRVHQRQRFHCGALEYRLQVSVFTVGGHKFHILDHNILNKDIIFAVNLGMIRGRVSILKMSST